MYEKLVMDSLEMRTIKISNLYDQRINEELLYELFLQAGPINSITMPMGPNGRRTMAIIEYTHESAVPFAMFIFEGTELYDSPLYLTCDNPNPPSFYSENDFDESNNGSVPFLPFNDPMCSNNQTNLIMNTTNSSPNEPNFDALLKMGQNMFMPPPFGVNGPMSFNLISPNNYTNQNRGGSNIPRDCDRSRDNYRDRDRNIPTGHDNYRNDNYNNRNHKNWRR